MMASTKLSELAASLVDRVAPGIVQDDQHQEELSDWVLREIKQDSHGGTRREWLDTSKALDGLARTARVRVLDEYANALDGVHARLEAKVAVAVAWEGDSAVKMSNIPQYVQLLLNLSTRPSAAALEFAAELSQRRSSSADELTADQLLYQEIMAEPFSGAHWQKGYNEEVTRGWTDSGDDDHDTDAEDEDEAEDLITPDSRAALRRRHPTARTTPGADERERRLWEQEERVREARAELAKRARESYWLSGGQPVEQPPHGLYGWKDLTTRLTACQLDTMLQRGAEANGRRAMSASDMQRELLYALSCRPNMFYDLSLTDGSSKIKTDVPLVRHLSAAGLQGILERFGVRVGQIWRIHCLAHPSVVHSGLPDKTWKTTQAFPEGCRSILQEIMSWLSSVESSLINRDASLAPSALLPQAGLAASPMLLLQELEHRHGLVLDHVAALLPFAYQPVLLLDLLYSITDSLQETTYPDPVQPTTLVRLLVSSAEPLWSMLGDWLQRGMPCPVAVLNIDAGTPLSDEDDRKLDPEFWIMRDRDVSWTDEDFWDTGYVVRSAAAAAAASEGGAGWDARGRTDAEDPGWPSWLDAPGVRDIVIEAGKARGLMRGLTGMTRTVVPWPRLQEVLRPSTDVPVSTEGLLDPKPSVTLADYLRPICAESTSTLREALEHDCGLSEHLAAVNDLLFMRDDILLDEWSDWLLEQIRRGRLWTDFQTLTASTRDLIESRPEPRIHPATIRIRASRQAKDAGSLQDKLQHIRATYEMPFPLSQLFTSTSMDLRSDTFTFLLQLLCARKQLVHAARKHRQSLQTPWLSPSNDDHLLLNLRQRLSWVLDVLNVWLNERVLDKLVEDHVVRLRDASGLGTMIQLELKHARAIRTFSFQHASTETVNDAVSELLQLSDEVSALLRLASRKRDSLVNESRPSSSAIRSRQVPRAQRSRTDDSDDEGLDQDEDEDENGNLEGPAPGVGIREQALQLWRAIDDQVLVLRDQVDIYSDGQEGLDNDQTLRTMWSILSFMLQDWR